MTAHNANRSVKGQNAWSWLQFHAMNRKTISITQSINKRREDTCITEVPSITPFYVEISEKGAKLVQCEGVLWMETLSCWDSPGASSRRASSRQCSKITEMECPPCCRVDLYNRSCVSTSSWYTSIQSLMCPRTLVKRDLKDVLHAWRALEWRDALAELTRFVWRLSCLCKSVMKSWTLWCFFSTASYSNYTQERSRATACSIFRSTSAWVCNTDKPCSLCA